MQSLPFETATQFAALLLTLVAGWFLGMASSSGGRRWRERYYDLDVDQAGYRDRAEQDLREANRRIRDLEAENAKLRANAPVVKEGHSTGTVLGAAAVGAAAGAIAANAADKDEKVADAPAEPMRSEH